MLTEKDFFRLIKKTKGPERDLTRLALADWYEERGLRVEGLVQRLLTRRELFTTHHRAVLIKYDKVVGEEKFTGPPREAWAFYSWAEGNYVARTREGMWALRRSNMVWTFNEDLKTWRVTKGGPTTYVDTQAPEWGEEWLILAGEYWVSLQT